MAYEGCTAVELRRALEALGWAQVEISDRLGVSEETVSRWVNGHSKTPKYVWAYLSFAEVLRESGVVAGSLVARRFVYGLHCPACGQAIKPPAKTNAERQRAYRAKAAG